MDKCLETDRLEERDRELETMCVRMDKCLEIDRLEPSRGTKGPLENVHT